ncbi:MAG: DNA-processing protein DprA [Chromatiales bacterium]|jgi:DNA processing protein
MDEADRRDPERLRAWLALLHARGTGSVAIKGLIEQGLRPADLARLSQSELHALGITPEAARYLRSGDWPEAEPGLAWLGADADRHLLTLDDDRYPAQLREIADPPPLLFVQGDWRTLHDPQVAVVGSRNPTVDGRANARGFAAYLSRAGLAVTSGLATGIDAAAHRGALDAGGPTIAVLGTGADRVYPAQHRELAHAIAAGGALVAELPPGTSVRAAHFPRRNRIISGLSLGVLVVEATIRSGSLITARLAGEHGREVFAIPGSIHNPLARGCHALIRQGAKLVEEAGDVLAELAPLLGAGQYPAEEQPTAAARELPPDALDDDYRSLLESLGFDPQPVDVLVERTGLPAETVASMLLLLEMQGHVSSAPGGRFARSSHS